MAVIGFRFYKSVDFIMFEWYLWIFIIGKFDYLNCYFVMCVGWKSKKNKGFNDMMYDIWFLMENHEKYWFLRIILEFCMSAWKLSLCRDELAYRQHEKQNVCSSFCYPPLEKFGFFPFYRDINICFDLSDPSKLDLLQVVLKTICNGI